MLKKIIALALIITGIILAYNLAFVQPMNTMNGDATFLAQTYQIQDIIPMNKDNMMEMAIETRNQAIELFKISMRNSFHQNVDVQIKPFSEKQKGGSVLWDPKDNKGFKLVIYEKNGVLVGSQINAYFLAYTIYAELSPWPFDAYMADREVIERLKRNEAKNPRGFLHYIYINVDKEFPDEVKKTIADNHLTKNEYLAVYSAALLHYSLINMYLHKVIVVERAQRDGHYRRQGVSISFPDNRAKKELAVFKKNPGTWTIALMAYHQEKHWVYFKYIYYQKLLLVFAALALVIFFIIQFSRKSFKEIIREELTEHGITLTSRMVYSIFWNNWKYLFYQPKNKRAREPVRKIAQQMADDLRDKEIKRKAKELMKQAETLWKSLSTMLDEDSKKRLEGNFKKAIDPEASLQVRLNALDILNDHLMIYSAPVVKNQQVQSQPKNKKKKERGSSIRDELRDQVRSLMDINEEILNQLSINNLRHLISALKILPSIDPYATSAFMEVGLKKMLQNKKFINALFFEDHAIISDCLNLAKRKEQVQQMNEQAIIDEARLKDMNVIVTDSPKTSGKRIQLKKWLKLFSPDRITFIPGSNFARLGTDIPNADLVILMRPLDPAAAVTIKSLTDKTVWINHVTKGEFLAELNTFLTELT